MKIKSLLVKPFATYTAKQIKKGMATALEDQQNLFNELLKTGAKTEFGKAHDFASIKLTQILSETYPSEIMKAFALTLKK